MSIDIFDKADKLAEKLDKQKVIEIIKCNENLWENGIIEVITNNVVGGNLAFKINIEEDDFTRNKFTGTIEEIWFWSEEYEPVPVTFPDLFWWRDTEIKISFEVPQGKMER